MLKLVSVFFLAASVGAEPAVESELGRIIGSVRSVENFNVESFLGIPFAKAPTGGRRFALPEPFGPLGEFEARKYGPSCAQPIIIPSNKAKAAASAEDCLYLNVFRREGTQSGDDKPVIAVFHGGAFSMGSASEVSANAAPLAGLGDVITVSFNYRLGIFGFADIENIVPGNLGLYDQRLALQWIHDNIRSFGGGPDKVTLMGFSAGSMSVSAQIMTPLNSGMSLFQSAIMDAGVLGVGIETSTRSNLPRLKKIAAELGCETEGEKLLACLRHASVEDLNRLQFDPEGYSTIATFPPTIDGVFIPQSIDTEIRENADKFAKVRTIIGVSQDEGTLFARYYLDGRAFPDLRSEDEFVAHLARFRDSKGFSLELEDPDVRQKVIDTYYKSYSHPFYGVSRFISDAYYVCPTGAFVEEYSQYNDDVYFYHFNRRLQGTYFNLNVSTLGAFHGGAFLHFTGALLDAGITVEDADKEYFLDTVRMISDFAKNDGAPKLRGVEWLAFSEKPQFLRIDDEPVMNGGTPYKEHCALFEPVQKKKPSSKSEL